MPRKAKIITKEESQKIKEKKALSQDEVNTLEQMLDNDEKEADLSEVRESQRDQREPRKERTSPSLDKVNAPQRIPTRLEGSFANTPSTNNNPVGEEEDPLKYISGANQQGEKKYFHYNEKLIESSITHRELETMGKTIIPRREIGFENSPQTKVGLTDNVEKYTLPKKIEREKLGKESPFEKKEVKYTPSGY
jgi:hypothetical protein